ncbi:hypothetical protein [Halanaerobacter jeridensis]|uniref:Integron cassette protein domain-containing protein n=1 Tax=Halanaerobacter jeridensis TaxID=706427 RepID=A0A938XZE3_9FIRM|nr:hypothetical protein [Halanaerobacter jeridensis]MBM7558120.1 hypothetical protein [Halanaerobacter jeridensis]
MSHDQTIGDEFTFKVHTERWGHNDNYTVKRTQDGWEISNIAIGGECDKSGDPYLFKNFKQDFIDYPINIGEYMISIWERAKSENWNHQEVQEALDRVANWVSQCEENSPKDLLR